MTKAQLKKAAAREKAKKLAARAERLTVAGYPADHNPYLAHAPTPTCYAGCKHGAPADYSPTPGEQAYARTLRETLAEIGAWERGERTGTAEEKARALYAASAKLAAAEGARDRAALAHRAPSGDEVVA